MGMPDLRKCHDCGVKPGSFHSPGCDNERCRMCGGQSISCDCIYKVTGIDTAMMDETHPEVYSNGPTDSMCEVFEAAIERLGGRLPWTGESPYDAPCKAAGWYAHLVPGEGWKRCTKDHPDAIPDANRLVSEGRWDQALGVWVAVLSS